MPVLLFLFGVATLAFVAGNANAKTPKAARSPYQLDARIDARTRALVETALASENDPARLEAFADALASQFPYAAWNLRAKAGGLRRMGYGAPRALPQPTPDRAADGLDATLPANVRFNVVELLTHGNDPAMLDAAAFQLANYPLAAAQLRLRAAFLRSVGPASGAPSAASSAGAQAPAWGGNTSANQTPNQAAAPSSTPEATSSPAFPPLPGLDPGMRPEIAMQVATALMTENDPAKLRALGNSLQPSSPMAATMLLGKANAIAPPAPTQPVPVPNLPAGAPSRSEPSKVEPASFPSVVPGSPTPVPNAQTSAFPGLFDANMAPDDQARVVSVLSSENDPTRLRQFADSIAARYPKAALLVTNKAEAVQTLLLAAAPPVLPPAAPAILPTVAPTVVVAPPVVASGKTYRVKQGDFPIKIAKRFGQPEAAWRDLVAANSHKPKTPDGNFKSLLPGEDLNLPASWPADPSQLPAAPKEAPIAPVLQSTPAPTAAGPALDPGMPGNVVTAVLNALATETDPAKLRGFASSIMGTYPIAAGVLLAKADTFGFLTSKGVTPPAAPAVLRPTPSLAAPAVAGTYRVQRGDSPSRIAKKLVGNDRRWPELVAANAQKAKAPDGNFKSLQPNEILQLPASWVSQSNGAANQGIRA